MPAAFHRALGVDPKEYDFQVFAITSEISRQVFPLTLDIDNPGFGPGWSGSGLRPRHRGREGAGRDSGQARHAGHAARVPSPSGG